ncbi:MAG TPA: carboxypeptidase-like regulatory domain-containing protein [Alloacidobacterium sp.]|nr:carboxypeptidase-like regulatory domain-containing protein [Alloacidobacterium sp.]
MRYLVRFFVCTWMLGLACVCAFGQTRVDGQVQNGDRFHPVSGATIQLVNPAIKFVQTTKTDDDGNFEFPVVPPQSGYLINVLDANGKIIATSEPFDLNVGQAHTTLPPIDISQALAPPPVPVVTPPTASTTPPASAGQPTPVTPAKPPPLALVTPPKSQSIQNDTNVSLSANITRTQLSELPLFNRNFLALGLFLPGVHDVDPGSPLAGAAFSISGSRTTANNFQLDSNNNVASSTNQAIPFQVNDSVQEFRIVYANPDLRYGQGSGGVVDVVTNRGQSKGGAWHGTAFGYFNDDVLNAGTPLSVYSATTFAKAAAYAGNTSADPNEVADEQIGNAEAGFISYAPTTYNSLYRLLTTLVAQPGQSAGLANCRATAGSICTSGAFDGNAVLAQNDSHTQPFNSKQFGGNIGGPLGERLFLFGSYEGTLINNPNPIFERVPTAADFSTSGLSLNAGDAAIANNVLSLFPRPNVQGANTGTFGFYKGTAPNYTNVHNLLVRPDIDLRSKGQLSLRYAGQILDQLHDDTLPANSPSGYPGNGANRRAQNQSVALVHTLAFANGRSVNEARISFTQYRVDEVAQDRKFSSPAIPGTSLETYVLSGVDNRLSGATPGTPGGVGGWYDSFWQQAPGNPTYSPSPITPSLDGDFPFARIGAPLSAPSARRDTQWQVSDTFTFAAGARNRITVGADYRYIQNFDFEGGSARGIIVSNNIGSFTSDSETCISCGNGFSHPSFDYELKQPSGYVGDLRSYVATGFFEDKFQARSGLTLEAGLRYNFFGQPWDTNNRLWNYSHDADGLVHQGAPGTYDAFAYQCAASGDTETHLDSLYAAQRITFNTGWGCNPNAKFTLPADKKSFAPHFGFSYAVDSQSNNVIRGAVGMYYDHLPGSYTEQLLLNRPSPLNVNSPSAIYGQNFYSTGCPGGISGGQCSFGLSTLNPANLSPAATAAFDTYQAASGAGPIFERDTHNLRNPYTFQFHLDYQHKLARSWTSEASYVGMLGRRLPLIYDSNFLQEFYCTASSSTGQPSGLCNNNTFFPVFTESNVGSSNYHSLILQLRSEAWHGLLVNAAYTFSKSMDNIAGSNFPHTNDALWNQIFGRQLYGLGNPTAFALGANPLGVGGEGGRGGQLQPGNCNQNPSCLFHAILAEATIPSFDAISSALTTTGNRPVIVTQYSLPQDPLNFSRDDYGRSDFDTAHRIVADFVYDLPWFAHSTWLNGFSLSGVFSAQTGLPYTIFSGPAYGQITQRVNIAGKVQTTGKPGQFFANLNQFTTAAVADRATNSCPNLYATPTLYSGSAGRACTGTSSRNTYSGPSFISQDFAVQKRTRMFADHGVLVLRAEFFNLFNRANYYNPITEFSTDGVHLNPEFGIIRSAHDPRQIQLAVRFDF